MGTHPINLAFRFLLELTVLAAAGTWGWRQGEGWSRYLWAIGLPLLLAALWGTFAVPGDPSRSGSAPVPTNGMVRLALELAFFAFAAWVLYDMGYGRWGAAMGVLVVVHYVLSYDRVQWLLEQ
ncbi:MAG: DUF2568 domain-containing protein [Bacteroidetes bacterium]|nr:MAG: DUF2568 domain-containing protein [Bacteroidota bacterium]